MRNYQHEMLREIYEQPDAIRRTIAMYCRKDGLDDDFASSLTRWRNERGEILIAASGSSRHCGLAAETILEEQCGLAVDVEYASEYICRSGDDRRKPSVIVLSQSGETSDTLAALREARARGHRTLAITNVEESTMAREADLSMPLGAGREKAIPATKSFTCQLCAISLLALFESSAQGSLEAAELRRSLDALRSSADMIERSLPMWESKMEALAKKYAQASTFLFLGRASHYAIAREGALKLKEASYVHAEGYPTGELKHGPNALVSERVPLVVLATVDEENAGSRLRYEKSLQLLREMKQQGARVIALANSGDENVSSLVSDCVWIDQAPENLLPMVEVVPLQLFAYFMALEHGVNVDRPRNLAKAVVEQHA